MDQLPDFKWFYRCNNKSGKTLKINIKIIHNKDFETESAREAYLVIVLLFAIFFFFGLGVELGNPVRESNALLSASDLLTYHIDT